MKAILLSALLLQGQATVVFVEGAAESGEARLGSSSAPMAPCTYKKKKGICGFIGVGPEEKPGKKTVSVKWSTGEASLPLTVKEASYQVSILKVDPEQAEPPEELKARIAAERIEADAVYSSSAGEPLWAPPMALPGKGLVTSRYGNRRKFNGQTKSIHQGVDLRAGVGAKVLAAAAGKVRLAKEFFFAGNFIAIDHGLGVFTTYSHLSQFKVPVDTVVKKGQVLGLAGATGRVTGPHLHWGVRVNGVLVDPLQFRAVAAKVRFR